MEKKQQGGAVFNSAQLEILLRAKDNPSFFIHNFAKIQHPVNGITPFELTDYQIRYVSAIKDNAKLLALTPRQIGGTSIGAAIALHTALFTPNSMIAYIVQGHAQAADIRKRINLMLENLPAFMQLPVHANNRNSIEFVNRSKIVFITSPCQLRGLSINSLILDQPFYFKSQDELLETVLPCISTGARLLAFGVPNHGAFYELFERAEKGLIDITTYRFNITEFSEKFLSQREHFGEEAYNREFLCKIE